MRLAAAAPMEPVFAIPASKSALPGPKAIFDPRVMRKRGRKSGRRAETFFVFMKGISVAGQIPDLQKRNRGIHRPIVGDK